jgi:hypothetical protein
MKNVIMILVIGLIVFEFIEHMIFPVPAIFLVQKLRRGGEIKSESQIDIYEELIKGNRYHLDGGDSLGPGYEQSEAIRPQAY